MSTVNAARADGATQKSPGAATLITGLAAFMAGLDNLVVVTALPTMRVKLGGSLSDLEWTVNAYTLSFAVLMILGAAIGDRFGRRKIFVAGLLLFTAASAGAAVASGVGELIAFRAIQGAGAAIIMPLTLTLLTHAVPAEKRGAALGIYGAINGLSIAAGPLVGGLVVEHLSWQWIFWINVPVGLLLAPAAFRGLAESRGPNSRLDLMGTVLVSLGMFGIVYALISANGHGWGSTRVLLPLVAGLLIVALFVMWERRTAQPMLPMTMFRNRAFSAINLGGLLMSVGMFGITFLITQFMQTIQGLSPTEAGVRMLAWTAIPMVLAPIAGMVSDRIGGRPVVVLGLVFMAIGFGYWALVMEPNTSYLVQLPGYLLGGAGVSCFYAPLMNLLMGSVNPGEQGVASGTSAATREIGAALGIALLAYVFATNGGYASGQDFVNGFVPALWVGAVAVAVAAVVMLFAKRPADATSTVAVAAQGDQQQVESVA